MKVFSVLKMDKSEYKILENKGPVYQTVKEARSAFDRDYARWASRASLVRGDRPNWKAYESKVAQPKK